MPNPYFVSASESLKLEICECKDHVVISMDGEEVRTVEAKDTPTTIVLTRGLKRSDKTTIHHLQLQLWNKTAGHTLNAIIYTLDGKEVDGQPIKTFKAASKVRKSAEDLSIDDFYLQLHQPQPADPTGNVHTGDFYFQFD